MLLGGGLHLPAANDAVMGSFKNLNCKKTVKIFLKKGKRAFLVFVTKPEVPFPLFQVLQTCGATTMQAP